MNAEPHALIFTPDGRGRGLHTERVNLEHLGHLRVKRASRVEFDNVSQRWRVFAGDDGGRPVFSHPSRQVCLEWERAWLQQREDDKHGGPATQARSTQRKGST